ncbi:hypothetical protein A5892_00625 [Halotalea alkalilenta]|uniref:Uncharacterized protein n=1 Tax=Halotalea alkalilenta TaxID=376489 RepID=A0A172YAA0_9GAMM|nr:hypothetical protein A5892_00625 [Halotalea alkalilenta]
MPTIDRRRWERPNAEPKLSHANALLMLRRYAASAELLAHERLADGLANGAWRLEWRMGDGHHCAVLRISIMLRSTMRRDCSPGWMDAAMPPRRCISSQPGMTSHPGCCCLGVQACLSALGYAVPDRPSVHWPNRSPSISPGVSR